MTSAAPTILAAGAPSPPRFVVTGTDTGVGKTVFAAGLVAALDGDYWKPVQTGLDGPTDSDIVHRLTGLAAARIHPEAYRLAAPLAPLHAARAERTEIDPERLAMLPKTPRALVIEGAGGVLVPLTQSLSFADLFARWGLPTILVARTELGTINHTMLSIEALAARGVPLAGVAFIGPANPWAEAFVALKSHVAVLGRMPRLATLDRERSTAAFAACFDLAKLPGLADRFPPRLQGYQSGFD